MNPRVAGGRLTAERDAVQTAATLLRSIALEAGIPA